MVSVELFNVLRTVSISAVSCLFCTVAAEGTEATKPKEAKRKKRAKKRAKNIVVDKDLGLCWEVVCLRTRRMILREALGVFIPARDSLLHSGYFLLTSQSSVVLTTHCWN